MATPLIDCHSHSAYSGHGEGSVHDMVEAARNAGLAVYAQTEHLSLPASLDPLCEDSMSAQEACSYLEDLDREQRLLEQAGSRMRLVHGVEADWLPGRQEELAELCVPYDYVIGSIHFLEGLPLDNSDNMALWDSLGVDGVWERYLDAMVDMVCHSGPIRCLGHADLPKVFGARPSFNLRDAFGDIAALAKRQGLIAELNCAGWNKPAAEQYPSMQVLGLFRDAGLECTVGCDAHRPQMVGCHLDRAYQALFDAGYRHVVSPLAGGDLERFELS